MNEQNIQGLPEGMRVKCLVKHYVAYPYSVTYTAELEPAIPDPPRGSTNWIPSSRFPGYSQRKNASGHIELRPMEEDDPPDSPASPASNALHSELLRLRDVVDPQDVESIDRVLAASPTAEQSFAINKAHADKIDRIEEIAVALDNVGDLAFNKNAAIRFHRMADDLRKLDLRSASPTEITDSQMPEIPCCPVHEGMLKAGTLTKPLNKCIVCRRNECEELRDLIRHGLQGWTSEDAAYADALVQEWAQEDERIAAAMKESQKP